MVLEGVGVSAYLGVAQYITNLGYLTGAAAILSTEARHSAWVSSAVNKGSPWSGPLDTPLNLDQVYSLAGTLIICSLRASIDLIHRVSFSQFHHQLPID